MKVPTCRKTFRNAGAAFVTLTPREIQLAQLVTEGQQNKEIAAVLGISEGTVKVYMSALFAKLGASNRAELSAWASHHELELAGAGTAAKATVPAGNVLTDTQCCCGAPKYRGHAVCGGCYFWLTDEIKRGLYRPLGGGFEAAYAQAVELLARRREAIR